tara:strand:- start:25836 stop:27662 length:1827 start_codon:yes stop_codon:yes gene_type:complete
MATTIKSTALSFDAIKNNLKTFLADKPEFADYNFEASGLSNILDVLAYNTHYNALTANFALNESFLGTAQLRSSLVSLAEGIGYIPDSRTASKAVLNLSLNLSGVTGRPSTLQIPAGYKFNSVVDDTTFVFQTISDITATDDGAGIYEFQNSTGSKNIEVFEGTSRTKTFLVTKSSDNPVYIIQDEELDIDTAVVKVFDTPSSSSFTTYSNLLKATTINANSTVYILKESPNGNFELSFGNGVTLGRAPNDGGKITITYIATNGDAGDTAKVFEPQAKVTVLGTGYDLTVTTHARAVGGGEKESVESIRLNAPFQYASQNRMVTAVDYSALVLKNFSTLIKDIRAFGGEDAIDAEFGAVFLSVLFNDDVSTVTISDTKSQIQDLAKQLSVASFKLRFVDPIKTFIECKTFFQFNQNLTQLSRNTIQDNVNQVITDYFTTNTGRFGQSFRRSNLLSLIDASSPAILSSRMEVKMQRRFTPTLTVRQDHKIRYATQIAEADDKNLVIESSSFLFRGKNCVLRNRLGSNVLEVFNAEDSKIEIDNAGDFSSDTVNIVGLTVDNFVGANQFIKLSVTPANQSAVTPLREDIIEFDTTQSFTKIVDVDPNVTS